MSNVIGTVITEDGQVEYQMHETMQGTSAEGRQDANNVYEWATTPQGKAVMPHDVSDDTIIKLTNGPSLSVASAIQADFIHRDANGVLKTGPAPVTKEAEETNKKEVHPDLDVEQLDRQTEEKLGQFVANVGQGEQITALNEIANTGEISERTMGTIASQLGIEPGQFAEDFAPVREAFEQQAKDAVAAEGVDPDDFFEWAYDAMGREMADAIKRQGSLGRTDGYKALAKQYLTNLDSINPDAVLNANLGDDVGVHRDHAGKIIITDKRNGSTFTWASAMHAGIIRLAYE